MIIFPGFRRSLLLTIIFSFIAPTLLVGVLLITLSLSGYIPGLEEISRAIVEPILQFLNTFGSGNSLRGLVVIGTTSSLVGALFDTYAFYHQNLRGD